MLGISATVQYSQVASVAKQDFGKAIVVVNVAAPSGLTLWNVLRKKQGLKTKVKPN